MGEGGWVWVMMGSFAVRYVDGATTDRFADMLLRATLEMRECSSNCSFLTCYLPSFHFADVFLKMTLEMQACSSKCFLSYLLPSILPPPVRRILRFTFNFLSLDHVRAFVCLDMARAWVAVLSLFERDIRNVIHRSFDIRGHTYPHDRYSSVEQSRIAGKTMYVQKSIILSIKLMLF